MGSCFAGVGGLELGLGQALERHGLPHRVVWQCEISPFGREVLARHWPGARRFVDVRSLNNPPAVDVLCGGFPCTDLSDVSHGAGAGLEGEQSGLWFEMLRVVEEAQPRLVVVENVDGAARKRWLPAVRRSLHRVGYACLSFRVRACDVGAPFKGSRIFVLAAPYFEGQPAFTVDEQVAILREAAGASRQEWGQPSPTALGVAHGLPRGLDRARVQAVGRAVVPAAAVAVGNIAMTLLRRGWWEALS